MLPRSDTCAEWAGRASDLPLLRVGRRIRNPSRKRSCARLVSQVRLKVDPRGRPPV